MNASPTILLRSAQISEACASNLGMRRVRHSIVLSLWPNCLRALLCCSACTRLRLRWIIYPVTLRSFIRKDSLFSLFVFCRAHCIRSEWIRIMGNCPGVLTHAMLEVRPVDHSVFRRSPLTRRCTLSLVCASSSKPIVRRSNVLLNYPTLIRRHRQLPWWS